MAIWGEVTPGAILTKCGLWGDMVDVIMCAVFRHCRLMGVGVVRGVSLPSPIDLTHRPYNTGHWCDRVIPGFNNVGHHLGGMMSAILTFHNWLSTVNYGADVTLLSTMATYAKRLKNNQQCVPPA